MKTLGTNRESGRGLDDAELLRAARVMIEQMRLIWASPSGGVLEPELQDANLSIAVRASNGDVLLKNYGPGDASDTEITASPGDPISLGWADLGRAFELSEDNRVSQGRLRAGEEIKIGVVHPAEDDAVRPNSAYFVQVAWTNPSGERVEGTRAVPRPTYGSIDASPSTPSGSEVAPITHSFHD